MINAGLMFDEAILIFFSYYLEDCQCLFTCKTFLIDTIHFLQTCCIATLRDMYAPIFVLKFGWEIW